VLLCGGAASLSFKTGTTVKSTDHEIDGTAAPPAPSRSPASSSSLKKPATGSGPPSSLCARFERNRVCLLTIYSCGLRLLEGCNLKVSNIDSGGGISRDGHKWLPAQRDFLMPQRAVAKIFRAKFRDALRQEAPVLCQSALLRLLESAPAETPRSSPGSVWCNIGVSERTQPGRTSRHG
jgi:hypothetical protein